MQQTSTKCKKKWRYWKKMSDSSDIWTKAVLNTKINGVEKKNAGCK